jgi:hypothetical protein
VTTTDGGDAVSAEETPANDLKIHAVVPMHQVPDVNLNAMLVIADHIGLPVTLYMPWGIATGNIAPPNLYYQHLADSVRAGNLPADAPESWGEVIDRFAEVHFDPYTEMETGARRQNAVVDGFDVTSHFALKDAVCWIGGFSQPTRHDYLRVRLADVTAWAWGKAADD